MTTQMLRRRGFSVIPVESAKEALSLVRQKGNEIDILLSDIIMPEVDGFELVNRMRRDHPDISVILMSGCASDEMDSNGNVSHGIPILQKPFGSDQLYEMIDLTLKSRKT
ncbi:MAG: response regulator [Planctomycetes bacterium]|nr:response regulator [Planctomycetota bacterium]